MDVPLDCFYVILLELRFHVSDYLITSFNEYKTRFNRESICPDVLFGFIWTYMGYSYFTFFINDVIFAFLF